MEEPSRPSEHSNLIRTGVQPGFYTCANIHVNEYGQVLEASNGIYSAVPLSRKIRTGAGLGGGGQLIQDLSLSVLASNSTINVEVNGLSVNGAALTDIPLSSINGLDLKLKEFLTNDLVVYAGAGLEGGGFLSVSPTLSVKVANDTIDVSTNGICVNASKLKDIPKSSIVGLNSDLGNKVNVSTKIVTGPGLKGGKDLGSDILVSLFLNSKGGLTYNLGDNTNELGVAAGGVTNSMLANPSITVNALNGLAGGGSAELGSSLDLSLKAADGSINLTIDGISVNPSGLANIPVSSVRDLVKILSVKVDNSVTLKAGPGLAGGGALAQDIALTVKNSDDSIKVGANGISVNPLGLSNVPLTAICDLQDALKGFLSAQTSINAGPGLTGSAKLCDGVTLSIKAADDSIGVNEAGVSVNVTKLKGIPTSAIVNLAGTNTGDQAIVLAGDVKGSGTTGIDAKVVRVQGSPVSEAKPKVGQILLFKDSWTPTTLNDVVKKTDDYTLTQEDFNNHVILLCDSTNKSFNVKLPDPRVIVGKVHIKDMAGNFSNNYVMLQRFANETIEGLAADKALQANHGSWTVCSDGTGWYLI